MADPVLEMKSGLKNFLSVKRSLRICYGAFRYSGKVDKKTSENSDGFTFDILFDAVFEGA